MANKNFRLVKRPPNASIQHKRVRSEVLKRFDKNLETHKRSYERLVAPWDEAEDKPEFTTRIEVSPTKIRGWVEFDAPDAPSARKSVFELLDKGTSSRPGIMTPDFLAKTSPGVKTSRAGRGGLAYVDPLNPAPGIEAREFVNTINGDLEDSADKLIDQGYKAGAKKLGK